MGNAQRLHRELAGPKPPITWMTYCALFNEQIMERPRRVFEQNFRGRIFSWQGTCVRLGDPHGSTLFRKQHFQFRMDPNERSSDINIEVPPHLWELTSGWRVGDRIAFTARMKTQGGTTFNHVMTLIPPHEALCSRDRSPLTWVDFVRVCFVQECGVAAQTLAQYRFEEWFKGHHFTLMATVEKKRLPHVKVAIDGFILNLQTGAEFIAAFDPIRQGTNIVFTGMWSAIRELQLKALHAPTHCSVMPPGTVITYIDTRCLAFFGNASSGIFAPGVHPPMLPPGTLLGPGATVLPPPTFMPVSPPWPRGPTALGAPVPSAPPPPPGVAPPPLPLPRPAVPFGMSSGQAAALRDASASAAAVAAARQQNLSDARSASVLPAKHCASAATEVGVCAAAGSAEPRPGADEAARSSSPADASTPTHSVFGSAPPAGYCTVCLENPAVMLFVPCGHIATCPECCETVMGRAKRECPICRGPITQAVKAFFAGAPAEDASPSPTSGAPAASSSSSAEAAPSTAQSPGAPLAAVPTSAPPGPPPAQAPPAPAPSTAMSAASAAPTEVQTDDDNNSYNEEDSNKRSGCIQS